MKIVIRTLAFIYLLIILTECEEAEVTPRDYPRLITEAPTENSADGATFNASFRFRGDFEIRSYGFTWRTVPDPNIINSDRVVRTGNLPSDGFSETISSALEEGTQYYVRAFVQTDEYLVYGQNITFVSQGSQAPIISSISPNRAAVGDIITIKGERFSYRRDQNIVAFNNELAGITLATDTLLQVRIPETLTDAESEISITIFGNKTVSTTKFELID